MFFTSGRRFRAWPIPPLNCLAPIIFCDNSSSAADWRVLCASCAQRPGDSRTHFLLAVRPEDPSRPSPRTRLVRRAHGHLPRDELSPHSPRMATIVRNGIRQATGKAFSALAQLPTPLDCINNTPLRPHWPRRLDTRPTPLLLGGERDHLHLVVGFAHLDERRMPRHPGRARSA